MNVKQKILIADDSGINRALLMEILGDGYEYLEAENGVRAVELLREHTDIALVLLDIMMPQMDGFDVLKVMRCYSWLDEIPVIMISAAKDTANIERAYDLGVADYMRRPFERVMVLRQVQNVLMLYAKQKRLIPYHVAEALVSLAYPYRPSSDATALSRMVYEGAVVESVLRLLPSSDVPSALGFTDDGYLWAVENEAPAWKAMIEKGLVHTADPAEIDRLVNPSPHTSILHPSSPGRMGRFMGHRIVRSYLEGHGGVRLPEILDSAFYNSPKVLVESDYYPE